jgi:hypothetical protein
MDDASKTSAALAARIETLALDLAGRSPTRKGQIEWRFGTRGSLAVVTSGPERGKYFDHEAGAGGDALDMVRHFRGGSIGEALAWSKSWLGGDTPQPQPSPQTPAERNNARKNSGMWREVWHEGQAAGRSLVETYLASRGLDLQAEAPLRFHPECPRGRDRMPAMLALMTDPITNEPCGLHRTFLKSDGSGKANVEPAKMMLGQAGLIRISPDETVTTGLGLCEGVETGLAIIQHADWRPVWAAASAGAIAKFPVLPGIECLTIFCDHDIAGVNAAQACARRWVAAGKEARIIAPRRFADWNDATMEAPCGA